MNFPEPFTFPHQASIVKASSWLFQKDKLYKLSTLRRGRLNLNWTTTVLQANIPFAASAMTVTISRREQTKEKFLFGTVRTERS